MAVKSRNKWQHKLCRWSLTLNPKSGSFYIYMLVDDMQQLTGLKWL